MGSGSLFGASASRRSLSLRPKAPHRGRPSSHRREPVSVRRRPFSHIRHLTHTHPVAAGGICAAIRCAGREVSRAGWGAPLHF